MNSIPHCDIAYKKAALSATQLARLLLAIMLSAVVGFSQAADETNKTLVVGSEQDYPPFATGTTDQSAGGFTVELWRAVAAESGLPYTIRVRPFHQILQEFKEGKIDVLINLAQSAERSEFADFTVPTVVVNGAIFVRKGESGIRSEADLSGKSIIVLNADLAHDYALSKGWQKQLILVETAAEGFRLLASGRHDVMLLSKLVGMQTLDTLHISNIEALAAKAGFAQKFSFAVRAGESELLSKINEGLALSKSTGRYTELYDEWFGVYEEKNVLAQIARKYLAPLVALLLGMVGWVFYRRNVERRRVEATLRKSKASLHAILDNLPYMVWLKDCAGHYLEVNEYYLNYARRTDKREIVGKTDFELWPRELAEKYVADDTEVIATRRQKHVEETSLDGDRLRWVETFKSPVIDENGEVLGTTGFMRDITERKLRDAARLSESEERFRVLFYGLGDAIFVHHFQAEGESSCLDEVNEVACAWLGYTRQELLALTPLDIYAPEMGRDMATLCLELASTENITFEHAFVTRDGNLIPVEIRASHFLLNGENAIISVARNISERKRAERQLRALSAHLLTVREEEKARIAREIHDEFGGTLTAIKIDACWLERNLSACKKSAPLLARIASMCGLIDNAVSVTRRVIADLRPSLLDDLGLRAAIEWQAEQFQARTGIECRVSGTVADNEEGLDKAVAINLFRILQESLTNVSRHSGASKVAIVLRYGEEGIVLSVSDNGCGLVEEQLAAPNSYGLRGMFERVDYLGGSIVLDHPQGGGLAITISLPLMPGKEHGL